MGWLANLVSTGTLSQVLVGLSRTTILFIVSSGLTLILGVLRIPNVAHGSLYMLGAFSAYTVISLLGGGLSAFLAALVIAPMIVAAFGFVLERGFFSYLYDREHLMLLLPVFFGLTRKSPQYEFLVAGDVVSVPPKEFMPGCDEIRKARAK